MKNFNEKEEYSFEDIQLLIDNDVEESLYLDFKQAESLNKKDQNKRFDISKDVASFANSDGGVIVYGIKEKNHKAHSISFINGNDITKEWLEQVISSNIQRHIPDLKIYPIRENGDIEKSIYIVKIPASSEAPHLSKDKKFYKRFNFESVAMEEYEVRQLYGRKAKANLYISGFMFSEKKTDNINTFSVECSVKIKNDGDIPERFYKTNMYLYKLTGLENVTWEVYKNYEFTRIDNNRTLKISSQNKSVIYPQESIDTIRFNIEMPRDKMESILSKITVEIGLMYSNEKRFFKTDFKEYLEKQKK
ncbi:MAG: ATP-binding protein [Candidatus Delongbacteria bacterium]|jgi:predicted HTH transcriptional regulator|nr:ATP-binding protein [Candidatus Delongbacteria bacterium]